MDGSEPTLIGQQFVGDERRRERDIREIEVRRDDDIEVYTINRLGDSSGISALTWSGRVGSSQIRSGQDRHCPKDNLDVQMPNYITPPRSQHLLYRYAKHLSCSAQ